MNAIVKATQEVMFNIPREILNATFSNNSNSSLESKIISSVIRARVLVDCDLVGGTDIMIPIKKTEMRYDGLDGFVFYVPKKLTNNRTIFSAQSIMTTSTAYGEGISQDAVMNPVDNALNNMANSFRTYNVQVSTALEIIGENTIMCNAGIVYKNNLMLKATVGNDTVALSNINARSHLYFAQMCVLAVKAEIYNRLVVKMGEEYIRNGHALGVFKDQVDNYESANAEYMEFRSTTWASVAFMNDRHTYDAHIRNYFGNNT